MRKREMVIKEMSSAMQYTFEITMAGCGTNCMHCSVDGGPSRNMSFSDYIKCLKKLKPILDPLEGDISVTPGNEPLNHPEARKILSYTHEMMPKYYPDQPFDTPTTGVVFMRRKDKEEIIDVLPKIGANEVMLTLHGNEKHHNEIVRNPLGYQSIVDTAQYFHSQGFKIVYNLMVSKYLIEDWDTVVSFLKEHHSSKVHFTIPSYLPIERLNIYQKIRAEYDDCMKLKGRLCEIGIDEEKFFEKVESNCEKAIAQRFKDGFDYKKAEKQYPNWVFFNISQDLDIYYGNAGARTKLLGNLLKESEEELYQRIIAQKANYSYSAYYDVDKLPAIQSILEKVQPLQTNYVYSRESDCLYWWFNQCNIPDILLK